MARALSEIERLRQLRGGRTRDLSIRAVVADAARDAARVHKRLGELGAIWEELVPQTLVCRTALAGLHRGVLHVIVDSPAAAFELDRLLRGGLLEKLRARYRGTLVRVKTRQGKPQ